MQVLAVVSFIKIEVYTCEDVKNSIQGHTRIYFTLEVDPLPGRTPGTWNYALCKKNEILCKRSTVVLNFTVCIYQIDTHFSCIVNVNH